MKSAAAEAATAKPKIFLPSMVRSPSNVIDDLLVTAVGARRK